MKRLERPADGGDRRKTRNRSLKLGEIYRPVGETLHPPISYEIFPPKSGNYDNLIEELRTLKEFNPAANAISSPAPAANALCEDPALYGSSPCLQAGAISSPAPALISITYGAGGGNRSSTLELAKRIQSELELNLMQHFTCVCSTRGFIENYLKEIESLGVKNILALKGDLPKDFTDAPDALAAQDFAYANELVEFIASNSSLEIAVAGYPEKHPAALTLEDDIANLKRKIDAGGSAIFTQLFFENDNFYKYCELLVAKGIQKPVIAGILPVSNFSQLSKMASMCGVILPVKMVARFEKFKDNEADTIKAGIEFATQQCQKLTEFGVSGLHFYTLNRAEPTRTIIQNLS